RGESFHAVVELRATVAGRAREYRIEVWTLGEDRALLRILAPEADAGAGYLQVGDELWYYSPPVGRAIALPSLALGEALFGGGPSLGDLAHGALWGEHEAQAEPILGPDGTRAGYLLTLVPRPEAPVVYGRLEVTVTADYVLRALVYYDQRGEVLRTAEFGAPVPVGPFLFPTEVTVRDRGGDEFFQRILDPEFGLGIDASFFTVARLEGRE
ncbi:MAG: outer membrane lipoprotein-sorting protein, partial [Candidatus Acetothermia bacterium]|nr:outer membrane lipoprotein-sorting protein [Candidatus Acetothermia bacterium]